MSQIVLGVGTSHSPLLAIEPELWQERGKDDTRRERIVLTDGRVVSYRELAEQVKNRFAQEATPDNFVRQADAARVALDTLAAAIEQAQPDVLVVIGDDQEELFAKSHVPAFAIYSGVQIIMHPKSEIEPHLPTWNLQANKLYGMDSVHRYRAAPELAVNLIEHLIESGVDVSVASSVPDPSKAGFGHAYGFIAQRLCRHREIPLLPVMLNTYYPPNVPTPARCYDIGRLICAAIAANADELRVGIVASGGLTHFHTDEVFDRRILNAMRTRDSDLLRALPVSALRSGNSEILNWIMAAGALEALAINFSEYIAVRRTPAGTGIGLGFAVWRPSV